MQSEQADTDWGVDSDIVSEIIQRNVLINDVMYVMFSVASIRKCDVVFWMSVV